MADIRVRVIVEDQATGKLKAVDKNLGDLKKGFGDAGGQAVEFGSKVGGLVSKLSIAAGVATAAGVALNKAFDLGQQGAVISQTDKSFTLLMEKVGAAPDLLNQLSEAAGGTISQMQIMSSTSVLLAGTQGELASALANATPMLLEIARAAQKLNPSLGDTTFLYESLALGIKRASPLILDNLGLTIKIGEANEKYAEQLGKSVEALTAEEQKVALLNATLQAGQVLIDQVGGNTDSATDSFARLTTGVEELNNQLKVAVFQRIDPYVDVLADLIQAQVTGADTQIAWNNALIRFFELTGGGVGSIDRGSGFTPPEIPTPLRPGGSSLLGVNLSDLADGAGFATGAILKLISAGITLDDTLAADAQTTAEMREILEGAEGQTYGFAKSIEQLNREMRKTIRDKNAALPHLMTFSEALDRVGTARPSAIAGLISDIKFLLSGGAGIITLIEDINTAIAEGVDPESLIPALEAAFVASLKAAVESGDISETDAKQQLVDGLKLTTAEANDIWTEFETVTEAITEAERELKVAIVKDDRDGLLDQLETLFPSGISSRRYTVDIEFNVTGAEGLPGGTGGFGNSGGGTGSTAFKPGGASFVIPPGYEDHGWPVGPNMRAMSGEHVEVTPMGVGPQGGGNMPPIIVVMLDGQEVTGRFAAEAAAQIRQAMGSGAGYTGMG